MKTFLFSVVNEAGNECEHIYVSASSMSNALIEVEKVIKLTQDMSVSLVPNTKVVWESTTPCQVYEAMFDGRTTSELYAVNKVDDLRAIIKQDPVHISLSTEKARILIQK